MRRGRDHHHMTNGRPPSSVMSRVGMIIVPFYFLHVNKLVRSHPSMAGEGAYTWARAVAPIEPHPRSKLIPAQLQDWVTIFLGILVEATPFLLLGVAVSALVHVFVTEDALLKFVPKNPVLSLIPALGVGMLMPVCECGNVAVAR